MRIGSVTDVTLEIDPEDEVVRIPVTLGIEPQRISIPSGEAAPSEPYVMMAALVERGLRAQLKSGNLLTGELLVDLDFHPDSPPAKLDMSGHYPRIPSVPTQLEVLTASVTGLLNRLAALPLPELVDDLQAHGAERRGGGGLARHHPRDRGADRLGRRPARADRDAPATGRPAARPGRSRRSPRPIR